MTKSCSLKSQQKLFFLHLDQATSCCRAQPVDLDCSQPLLHYLELWQQEQHELEQGHELAGCEHCWQDERRGLTSYRQQLAGVDSNHIEIFASNLCNQMCSYCSPQFSSEWAQSIRSQGPFVKISNSAQTNLAVPMRASHSDYWLAQLSQYLETVPNNSVSIKLLGGEPLMQKSNLQDLLQFNSNKVSQLLINTNLNPPNNKFLHWVLDTFPKSKLQFEISLDATPEYNAVPRAGFDAQRFLHNLELVKKHKIGFVFLSVISVLSVFDLANYQTWLNQNQYQARFFKLNHPDCLDARYLPDHVRQELWNDSLPIVAQELLQAPVNALDLKLFEQYNYLEQYFKRTQTDPMLYAGLNQYWTWLTERQK